jgi:hypothetical protein
VWKERIIVVVSHDRAFLDEVCSDVLHISGAARRLTQSHGNYTLWAARRAEQQAAYAKEAMLRGKEVDRMKEFAGTRKMASRGASRFGVGFHYYSIYYFYASRPTCRSNVSCAKGTASSTAGAATRSTR